MDARSLDEIERQATNVSPDVGAYVRRLLADLETLSRAATELSERETRLLDGCRTAWYCLQRPGPLSEREQWARDVLVQALGGRPPTWSGPSHPYDAARAYIGDDYPVRGWPEGARPQPAASRPDENPPRRKPRQP